MQYVRHNKNAAQERARNIRKMMQTLVKCTALNNFDNILVPKYTYSVSLQCNYFNQEL